MPEYFISICPSKVENFYTVTYGMESSSEVWIFSDIPYKLAFASLTDPVRGLVILRAYEAFEAFMLMEDPESEAEVLTQRLEKLKELLT